MTKKDTIKNTIKILANVEVIIFMALITLVTFMISNFYGTMLFMVDCCAIFVQVLFMIRDEESEKES